MLLGLTGGELGLVAFICALVFSAALVPRAGAFVGRRLAPRPRRPPTGA